MRLITSFLTPLITAPKINDWQHHRNDWRVIGLITTVLVAKVSKPKAFFHLFLITMEINQIIHHSINENAQVRWNRVWKSAIFAFFSRKVTRFKIPVVTGVFLAHRLQLRSSLHWRDDDAMRKKILKIAQHMQILSSLLCCNFYFHTHFFKFLHRRWFVDHHIDIITNPDDVSTARLSSNIWSKSTKLQLCSDTHAGTKLWCWE